jgi:hypothetical protein
LPHQAKLLQTAAAKIKDSGLPPHAVSDKALRATLEDGSLDEDVLMQERWSNLLTHAATAKDGRFRIAHPKILAELESKEAQLLDHLFEKSPDPVTASGVTFGYDDTFRSRRHRRALQPGETWGGPLVGRPQRPGINSATGKSTLRESR